MVPPVITAVPPLERHHAEASVVDGDGASIGGGGVALTAVG